MTMSSKGWLIVALLLLEKGEEGFDEQDKGVDGPVVGP
jgi:hypothetical protein